MASRYSPPVLYLSDDDDDDHHQVTEHNIPFTSSLTFMNNDNLPRKKRKLIDNNVEINPSVINWSKRQRNDPHYQYQQPTNHSMHHMSEPFLINQDDYNIRDQQSHSFQAFDWTAEPRIDRRIYSNPIRTPPRLAIIPPSLQQQPPPPHPPPPSNVMNVVKHHLDHSDTMPMMPLSHQTDRYMQRSQRKSIHMSIPPVSQPTSSSSSSSSLPLPLPSPTSSIVRPQAQRIQPGKTNRISYTHSTPSVPLQPPPPPLIPAHRPIKSTFPNPPFRPLSPASISVPISTPEIRRQPLNGTGVLSAFYDSKCYRCNICKFKSPTSSTLLQHLFTHIFFCHQCPFYSHSHHTLYQHIFEKHNIKSDRDNIDPKNLDLLYITRCADGTFALCMDSSTPPPPPPAPVPSTVTKPVEKPVANNKPKAPKKKPPPKQKKDTTNVTIIVPQQCNINPPQSPAVTLPKRPLIKEKQPYTYVLMKHRRCYSIRFPPCLHALTLEYNICREHTIRHMCHTQDAVKRYKLRTKPKKHILFDDVAKCLKTIVNRIIEEEEKGETSAPLCALPDNILNKIFSIENENILSTHLKLNNKYNEFRNKREQNQVEYSVRASNQHVFLLSATGINKNEQSAVPSLQKSITNDDSTYVQTKLSALPISCDNTLRFLKGNLNTSTSLMNSITKKLDLLPRTYSSTNIELNDNIGPSRKRSMTGSSTSLTFDKNNNSITSVNSRSSPSPSVIVID